MALLTANKINQFGVTEEYWRVLSININLQYGYCDITMGAYASEETRLAGSEPMNIKKVRAKWNEEEFLKYFAPDTFESGIQTTSNIEVKSNTSNNIYERIYQYIKETDAYFADATDC